LVISAPDRGRRGAWVPVVTRRNDSVIANIITAESQVIGAKGAIRANDVPIVPCDVGVIANLVTRVASQVTAKASETGMELFEDDGLGFDFADLLRDDALGHFSEDCQSLLDNDDGLAVADNFIFLNNCLSEV